MKDILENSDTFTAYATIDAGYAMMQMAQEEFDKRKLKLPKLDRTNIDFQYKDKQFRKALALERNRKFSEKFK